MSLDTINHKLTTSAIDTNGVITWSNPSVDVTINSIGEVYKGEKKLEGHKFGIKLKGKVKTQPTPFTSLYSRMVLGIKLGTKTIKLKNPNLGYTENNIEIGRPCYDFKNNKVYFKTLDERPELDLEPKSVLQTKESVKAQTIATEIDEIITVSTTQYYTLYEAKNEHTTEDGAVFPTKELAEWHQEKVSKGKGNAQVVLDYNGGYVLAEQIYLQEVIYNKTKPYANFIDVLNNNNGVISLVQEEHCKFDKVTGNEFSMLTNFKLGDVFNLITTKHQAIKIQEALEQYVLAQKEFNNTTNYLGNLIKESI